ncbi:hypothetical protein KGP17_27700 (plasmid) [Serratia sp. JSRIV001]|uniref:methyltransferase domain-containing protein n=1 Tax=unclassified Serratia (in: enterobacteria) TaxID=2647522 RepID=UPI001CC02252|nr:MULTISPECIES: methyltransferase domain-containing protein [unclassified Serratia (in: enterobacteria)]UAN48802.1 hypothetical protein KGP17_27700 [Serratia sp. JSRIV001]UAN54566.1 hypothetical protein KGP26_28685 [Serratia sp. JSRIV002]UAN60560.1 hypothetical protein KGP21_28900 [Serratia sp. JSRIV004]
MKNKPTEYPGIRHEHMNLVSGIMQELSETSLLASWDRVFEAQTRILGPQELKWLETKGAFAGGVMEVGSGNGCYGSFLARNVPYCHFFGLEANQSLVNRFNLCDEQHPINYNIEKCIVGIDPIPKAILGHVQTCILRFVLQHSSDPVYILKQVCNILPPGAQIYIIEEDDRLFASNTEWSSYDATIDMWRRVCAEGGTNSKIGLELPGILNKAGFSIEDYTINLRNNIEMGSMFVELFSSIALMMYNTNPGVITKVELQKIIDGFSANQMHHVATYPQILLVAKKM